MTPYIKFSIIQIYDAIYVHFYLYYKEVIFVSASEAQKRATKKYLDEKLDRITVRVPKGEREKIHDHAESQAESVNEFIRRAINETIERDNQRG